MGLVNRLVKPGEALAEAKALAEQLCGFPWECLLTDRKATYENLDLTYEQGILNEFRLGLKPIEKGETMAGAGRFARGAGRHGSFKDLG